MLTCFHFKGHKSFHTLNPHCGSSGTNSQLQVAMMRRKWSIPCTDIQACSYLQLELCPLLTMSILTTEPEDLESSPGNILPSHQKELILSLMCAIFLRLVLVNKTVTPHTILEILFFWCPLMSDVICLFMLGCLQWSPLGWGVPWSTSSALSVAMYDQKIRKVCRTCPSLWCSLFEDFKNSLMI